MSSKSASKPQSAGVPLSSQSIDQVDLLVVRMAAGWRNGEQPTAAEILAAHPDLDDEAAIRLIFEEVSFRREAGLDVSTTEILSRYSRWQDELIPLLGFDRLLQSSGRFSEFDFPEVDDRIGDFQLLEELGRGASGRTFLAAQPSLADRPVVLKLMARNHSEHLSLARLQHTYIVPLYWEQEFPDFGLRGLLMPYLGGSNLAVVLDDLAKFPFQDRHGSDFNDALGRLAGPSRQRSSNEEQRYQQFLGSATYDQAACWIAVCLADALQYAHDRGLIHMDVKPSNVLIAGDGQPMLLDFHLARGPIPSGSTIHDRLGGTPGWTSPEQEAAMHAVFEGRDVEVAVDGRSDVYALGLLLYEMLGGAWGRESRDRIPKLSACNPAVSTGLSDIVHRSLAHNPEHRYPSASKLAEDLRCHLQDLPLKGVSNRNLLELWKKWRRRSPYASSRLAIVAAGLILVASTLIFANERKKAVQSWADESERLWARNDHDGSFNAASNGLALSKNTPVYHPGRDDLEKLRARANWARTADGLNGIANQVRFAYGAVSKENHDIQNLAPKLKKVWENRQTLNQAFDETDERVRDIRERLAIDFQEIAVVWSHLRTEITPKETALIEARDILVEAEKAFGTSRTLKREQDRLLNLFKVKEAKPEPEVSPRTAWEHYEDGRLYLQEELFEEAAVEFKKSLELDPRAFWTNFFDGYRAYQQMSFQEALAAFRVCMSLEPDSVSVRVNLALTYEALGDLDDAYRENCVVIRKVPGLIEGYLNRGNVEFKRHHAEEAKNDLLHALELGKHGNVENSTKARIRYILALTYRDLHDPEKSQAEAKKAEGLGSVEARSLLAPKAGRR